MARLAWLVAAAAVLLATVAGCTNDTSPVPTVILPTEVPTGVPSSVTPQVVGACTLLTAADLEDVLGDKVTQVSSSALSCGYQAGQVTVTLTLNRADAYDDFAASFATQGAGQEVDGLGDRAVYFPSLAEGLLMASVGSQTYLLSGVGDIGIARDLMARVIERHAAQAAD